jgi:hypothetical protein
MKVARNDVIRGGRSPSGIRKHRMARRGRHRLEDQKVCLREVSGQTRISAIRIPRVQFQVETRVPQQRLKRVDPCLGRQRPAEVARPDEDSLSRGTMYVEVV